MKLIIVILFSIITTNVFSQTFIEQTGIVLPGFVENGTVTWGDYNNDGFQDLLIAGSGFTKVYKNNSGISFTEQTSINLSGVSRCSAAWGDYNNDGYLDILLTGQEVTTANDISKIYKNNGNGTFSEQTNIQLTGVAFSSVAWGDLDNDGDLDILMTGNSVAGPISKVYSNKGNGIFTEQSGTSLTPVNYGSSTIGDYNNDGLPDILLTGRTGPSNSGGIVSKVYKNNGDDTFSEQTGIVLSQIWNGSVTWGDYDNDGFLDILLSGSTDSNKNINVTKIYKNNGNGNFVEQTSISLPGVHQSSVAWGDYDNDGLLDFLLTGATDRAARNNISKVYRNNGNNTFSEQTSIVLAGVSWGSVAWGDYNNDKKLDIILTGSYISSSVTKLYRNNTAVTNISPAAPTGLVGTINGTSVRFLWKPVKTDNTPFKGLTYNVRFGRNSLGGDIISPMSSSPGFRRIVAMGNVGHDTSMLTRNIFPGQYYWSVQAIDNGFLGGAFSVQQSLRVDSVQANALSVKILDNKSLLVRWKRGNGQRCIVFCRIGSGSGSLPSHNKTYVADNTFANGDQIGTTGWYCVYNGRADSLILKGLWPENTYSINVIEYIGISGSEQYYRELRADNSGSFSSGPFSEQTNIALAGVEDGSSAWADFNNDGYLDVLVSGRSLDAGRNIAKIYQNNGDGSFTALPDNTLPGLFRGCAIWGDYNNDGYLDILLTGSLDYTNGSQDASRIFKNNGNSTFTEQNSISLTGVIDAAAAFGDYDNDGFLDLVLTGFDVTNNKISKIYRNNRDNTFTEQTSISLIGIYSGRVAWGDYNKDGNLDLLMAGSAYNQSVSVIKLFRNNGNNTFTEQIGTSFPTSYTTSLSWGDYDNDGYLDILLFGSGFSKIYHNNSDGTFTENTGILFHEASGSSAWGDYNNDGYLDILVSGSKDGYTSKIYRNNGPPNYSFNEQTGVFTIGSGDGSAVWGDYNNDGNLDILITGRSSASTYSKIFRNNTSIRTGIFLPNKKPPSPEQIYSTQLPNIVKLQWTPVTTDETPASTMSYNIRYKKAGDINWMAAPQSINNGNRLLPTIGNLFLNSSFSLKYLSEGKYLWQLQAVDQGFQGGSWSAENSFDVKSVQAFYSADTVCLGLTTHFTDQSVATDGIASWKWDFKDGTSSSSQNPVHTYAASGNYFVKLVIMSNGGVKDSLEKNITVKSRPITGFTASTTCQGIPTVITNTTDNNSLSILSWYWNFGDGQTSTIQQPGPHGYLGAGNYSVLLKALANNGCIDSISQTVIVANYPVAAVTANAPLTFCKGDSVTLSVPTNTNYTYNWMVDGTTLTNGNLFSYNAKLTGNYSIEIVNSIGNCKTTSNVVIITAQNAPAAPLISAGGPMVFCQGDSTTLSITNTAGYSYQWKLNGGAVGKNSSQFNAKNAGSYNVVVSNSIGCSVSSLNFINVTVNSLPSVSPVNLSGPTNFCQGGNLDLSVALTSGYSYKWRNEYGLIAGANTNTYSVITSGNYQVEITNIIGCVTKTSPTNVLVKPMPSKPEISSDNYQAGKCPGETPLKLDIRQAVPGYSYSWYKNGISAGSSNSSFLEGFLSGGDYSVEANLNGCKVQSEVFNVYYPDAPIKPSIYIHGPKVWYLACSNNKARDYKWYYNGDLIAGADKYIYVANKKLGDYYVTISNDAGCYTSSDVIKIPVDGMSIEEGDPFAGLTIYPNPNSGQFTIEADNKLFGEVTISVLDHSGNEIFRSKSEKTSEKFNSQINFRYHSKGIYFVSLRINGLITKRKIIIE